MWRFEILAVSVRTLLMHFLSHESNLKNPFYSASRQRFIIFPPSPASEIIGPDWEDYKLMTFFQLGTDEGVDHPS